MTLKATINEKGPFIHTYSPNRENKNKTDDINENEMESHWTVYFNYETKTEEPLNLLTVRRPHSDMKKCWINILWQTFCLNTNGHDNIYIYTFVYWCERLLVTTILDFHSARFLAPLVRIKHELQFQPLIGMMRNIKSKPFFWICFFFVGIWQKVIVV